ncbi:MAG TPA: LytTR family DNA-binding domain-containing protein [Bacteroidia bacterium]|jgi:two-component system LytT family response regulator|nr:LytTR family DNA-binding domain-containing protein [Bacteroidia bacterium]
MIKAILVDDEINGAEALGALIRENCPEVNVIAIETDPESGIDLIRRLHPDLLFLDIEMPLMSGFELLEKIKDIPVQVVFTTAFDQYAVKAFKHNAVDYLLKPVIVSELMASVERVASRVKANENNADFNLDSLLMKIRGLQTRKLAVPSMNEIIYVDQDSISYLEADSNYTNIILTTGEKLSSTKTLKEYEAMLDKDFLRVFKTYIINLNHVKKFIKKDGGYILMSDGSNIAVSREKRQMVLEILSSR